MQEDVWSRGALQEDMWSSSWRICAWSNRRKCRVSTLTRTTHMYTHTQDRYVKHVDAHNTDI